MFHMLSCFDLDPEIHLDDFEQALDRYLEHMRELDLVVGRDPIGERQSDTIMDTDDERQQRYYMLMHFRDRAQCDASVAHIYEQDAQTDALHHAVYAKTQNMIFICWQDVD